MFNALIFRLADITVTPDFTGLPQNLVVGLTKLTNNALALLLLIAGLGIAISLILMVVGSWLHNPSVKERGIGGLFISSAAGGLFYVAIAFANYSTHLFR